MGELIARALQELKPKGPIVLSTRALRPDMNPRERLGHESIPTRVEMTPETRTKLKEARQVMGGRLILPGAVEPALGTRIDQRFINDFPFTSEQMKALRHDSVIMYFADETDKGAPITMSSIDKKRRQKMKKFYKNLFPGKGESICNRQGQEFYESQTPRPGWRSITLDIVPGTQDQDALGQMRSLINYLQTEDKKVLGNSEKLVAAIEEFDHQEQALSHLIPFYPEEGTQRLTELAIAKLTIPTAVELAYANVVLGASSDRKFLERCYSSTLCRDSYYKREIIQIRNGGRGRGVPGVSKDDIFGMIPTRFYPSHGTVLSLGADALLTLPSKEEAQVFSPVIITNSEKEIDKPFDPERDIPEEDRENILANFNIKRKKRDSVYKTGYYRYDDRYPYTLEYADYAVKIRHLFPEIYSGSGRVQKPDKNDYYALLDMIAERTQYSLDRSEIFDYFFRASVENASIIRNIFGKKRSHGLDEKKNEIERIIDTDLRSGRQNNFLNVYADLNMIFPNWITQKYAEHFTPEKLRDSWNKVDQKDANIGFMLQDEASIRIITGRQCHFVDRNLIQRKIQWARENQEYDYLARLYENLLISTAEEVRVTDSGLVVNAKKPVEDKSILRRYSQNWTM